MNLTQIITSSGVNKVVVSDDNDNTVFTNNNMVTMTLDTVSLRPEVPINMNNQHKLVGLKDATDKLDAMNFGQSLRHQWM